MLCTRVCELSDYKFCYIYIYFSWPDRLCTTEYDVLCFNFLTTILYFYFRTIHKYGFDLNSP